MIPENFGAGTTGPGIAHLPKVIFIESRQALGVYTNFIDPDISSFIITDMHGDPQALFGQLEHFGEKLPGKANRFALEIIAKTKVAEHFKESVMSGGVANIFQIIVFATGADTALR